ncbi:hypothetical protein FGG08_001791 [Glutinoglossum americanum]|uniref:Uncharacterized protein n=1 Tax=Glutinoglossum americanum TaxID=1670608 RepID=A0A9P8IE17_9PEZI|nr:hypothetical protein FGG08_001791 [Glutinoglossum americanum]
MTVQASARLYGVMGTPISRASGCAHTANASYIIQAVLVFVFGPVYSIVYALVKSEGRREHLRNVFNMFLDTSAQFTIPVAVAAIVRLKQSAPFYEITFLQSLMTMQFLGLLSTIITAACVGAVGKVKTSTSRIMVVALYGLLDFSFFMSLVHHLHTSKASYQSLQELAAACTKYGSLLPGFVYIQKPHPHGLTLPKLSNPHALVTSAADERTGFRNLGIILGIVLAIVVGLILICVCIKKCGEEIAAFIGIAIAGVICASPIAFSIGVLYCLVQLERKRIIMKNIVGADFQDNQWGFGQVIALLLWVPLLVQALYWAMKSVNDASETPDAEPGRARSTPSTAKSTSQRNTQTSTKINPSPGGKGHDASRPPEIELGQEKTTSDTNAGSSQDGK